MLFMVSQSTGRTPPITEVVREFSLIFKTFAGADGLAALLAAPVRRILYLDEADLTAANFEAINRAPVEQPLGLIVCNARRPRSHDRAELITGINELENVVWVHDCDDVAELREATRRCWERMLRITPDELRRALAEREFVIQYQPKVERADGDQWQTREAESLIRWRHPEHGLLGPLEFLPEAEAFGLMGAITERVVEEASIQLRRWKRRGLNLNACINLAPSLLKDRDIVDRYADIVREHGHDCGSFTFEVAESDVAGSDAPHLRTLQRFRERGFRISLDDFGVAAASLGAFEQLPFDEIKIHAYALRRAKANPVARKVLAAVTGLAHSLGISVCAEGVEDQETYEFLQTIRCDKMQGFLISEAVMPEIIRRFYAADKDVDRVA